MPTPSKPSLEGLPTMQKVEEAARYVLEQLNARSNDSAQFGFTVFEEAEKEFPDAEFVKSTFLQYL